MKLNAGKRILMFFHWLFSLLICAAFAAYIIKPEWTMDLFRRVTGGLGDTQVMIIGIAVLAIYVILAVAEACLVFHRGKRPDRGFITVDSSDSGRVRIAVSAIEQMVRQSLTSIDGITEMKIGIENLDDAIAINIAAVLQSGCHVPTVTMNMQRCIRQFVEMNCGVAVRAVSISINAVSAAGEGGKRRSRRRDDAKPLEPAPVSMPMTDDNSDDRAPIVPQTPVTEPTVEPEAQQTVSETTESAPESIPDPEPIRLHFDHLTEQPTDDISTIPDADEAWEPAENLVDDEP